MKLRKTAKKYKSFDIRDINRGFSVSEIVRNISKIYNIPANKSFRKQVELALRRGVDYGILVKTRNKYRYDPEVSLLNSLRLTRSRRKAKYKLPRKVCMSSPEKKSPKKPQQIPPTVPRPTVPPPPSWATKPRNLTTEPFAKVIKHS